MAWDIAFHPGTGDWLFNARRDFTSVSGPDQIEQRIHTRIRIHLGEWIYDKKRTLGSQLNSALRMPRNRVLGEIPLMLQQALAPMQDVDILSIEVEEPDPNLREVRVHVHFRAKASESISPAALVSNDNVTFVDVPIT